MIKGLLNLPKNTLSYIRSTLRELRKVEWLKLKTVIKYTFLVILTAVVITLTIIAIDAVFAAIRNWLLTL
jgi:preprotein translocase SecE subunit